MKKSTKIWLWVLTVFFALSALVYFPSVFSILALLIVGLVIPLPKWQIILGRFIHRKLKVIIVIALIILTIITVPTTEADVTNNTPTIATEYTTAPTTEPTTVPTTEADTAPTTESTSAPTTESTSAPTTESTSAPTTEPTTAPATKPTTAPTTEPIIAPTTEPPHIHNFSEATCTAPKTCSCGATEGAANGHNWRDATYTSPKTCTICGATEGNPLDVPGKENYHGHVYTGGESSKKYHYEAQCAGKNSHEITWEEVERRNLGPCGTCVLK